jgi:hypothetical protein
MDRGATSPKSNEQDPRLGTVIRNKWRIDKVLGTGGMATVYAATHQNNGRRVAIKILHTELARDAGVRERFLREGYVGNKIPHRGRVEVLDDDETEDGAPFLLMELLEGQTIGELQKRSGKKLPLVQTLELAEQLLDVLAACHGQGIVHRDLKPANVFVTNEGVVKVLDFGVAQLREGQQNHTRAGMALGTPSFMSPEQARGLGDQLDGRSDIFSVGAMLYSMLSGQRLHKGRSNDEALVMAATQPAPSLARVAPDLPVEVIALVDKALAWDRRNRFSDAAEMKAAVSALLAAHRPREGAAAPAAPTTSAAAPIVTEAFTEEHPDVQRLRGLFRQLDRLLASVRQYGWEHPETSRKLRYAFEELVRGLGEAPEALRWSVRPYSFLHRDFDIWEPTAPLDLVPWALFEAGVRELALLPGITEEELRELVSVWLLDPSRDLPPEDDLATALWDRELEHVRVACAEDWAEGGAAQREAFYADSEGLERLADQAAQAARAEARAMAISVDRAAAQRDAFAFALGLDATTRRALSSQFALSNERWTERYVDVLIDALYEAARGKDVGALLGSLSASAADLVVAHRSDVLVGLFESILEVLKARYPQSGGLARKLILTLFGGEVLALLLQQATEPGGVPPGLPRAIELGLSQQDASMAPQALAALATEDGSLRASLLAYLGRVVEDAAPTIAEHLPRVSPPLGRELLALLARAKGDAARQALDAIAQGASPQLRLDLATLRGLSGEALARTVASLLEEHDPEVRRSALQVIAANRLKELGPGLVRRAEDPSFHALPTEERRALLDALWALNPPRAEVLSIHLLSQRQVLKTEGREQSRLVAAECLGDHGASAQVLEALAGAQKGWWGVSEELKAATQAATQKVQARMNIHREKTL